MGQGGAQPTPPPEQDSKSRVPWIVLLVIAALLVMAYVVAVFVLFSLAGDEGTKDEIWARYIVLLTGLEAIVFAAVGWLFGREVNRKQADQAEEASKAASENAEKTAEAKATGEGLKTAVLATSESEGGVGPASALDPRLLILRNIAINTKF
jgi:flagellar basal body-associated protein FliL